VANERTKLSSEKMKIKDLEEQATKQTNS